MDEIHVLLNRIISQINTYDYNSLPLGLTNGKLGYLFLNLTNTDSPLVDSFIPKLNKLISSYSDLPNGFFHGNFGLIWLLGKLFQYGVIDYSHRLLDYGFNVIEKNSLFFKNAAIQFDYRDDIYPFGIGMMAILPSENSINRYIWEEQIIFRLCDCEKILTTSIQNIYTPQHLSPSILHSIAAFAQLAKAKRIYTYKAIQIISLLSDLLPKIQEHNAIVDKYILSTLLDTHKHYIELITLDHLSDCGLYSSLYNYPELFEGLLTKFLKTHNLCNSIPNLTLEMLIGIGLGCLTLINKF